MVSVVELSWCDEKKLEDELYGRFVDLRFSGWGLAEVYDELGVSYRSAMAKRIRKRFKDEWGEFHNFNRDRSVDDRYVYRLNESRRFVIRKRVGGRYESFGRYEDIQVARKVRDRLVECGWDKSCLEDILFDLGIREED